MRLFNKKTVKNHRMKLWLKKICVVPLLMMTQVIASPFLMKPGQWQSINEVQINDKLGNTQEAQEYQVNCYTEETVQEVFPGFEEIYKNFVDSQVLDAENMCKTITLNTDEQQKQVTTCKLPDANVYTASLVMNSYHNQFYFVVIIMGNHPSNGRTTMKTEIRYLGSCTGQTLSASDTSS